MFDNAFEILGLDLGTYNVKTSEDVIFRSAYSDNTKYNVRDKKIIEYNGNRYQIGVGDLDTEIIKVNRKNQLPLFLYAIANSAKNNANLKLVMSLPSYQLDNEKYVDDYKKMFSGEFEFKLEGKCRKFKILDVTIFPEGMGAYYTIDADLSNRDVILLDIGGSTFNVLLFKNGEFIKAKSLPFGSMNLISDIHERAMSLHGKRIEYQDIINYIQRGRVGKTDDAMEYRHELAQPYIDKLIKLLTLEFPKDDADYYLNGGGVTMFAECIIKNLGDVNLIKDYLYANANGNKLIGEVIYRG